MSHLAHIVKLKAALIAEGIKSPEKQIAVVQTAYTKALISVAVQNDLKDPVCGEFNKYVLGYWNETTPNNGFVIMIQANDFFRKLKQSLSSAFTQSKIEVEVTPSIDGVDVKFEELELYKSLIQTLIDEANHKLSHYLERNPII